MNHRPSCPKTSIHGHGRCETSEVARVGDTSLLLYYVAQTESLKKRAGSGSRKQPETFEVG